MHSVDGILAPESMVRLFVKCLSQHLNLRLIDGVAPTDLLKVLARALQRVANTAFLLVLFLRRV